MDRLEQILANWLRGGYPLPTPSESGAYEYRCDGERQPIEETWSIHEIESGQQFVRSDRTVSAQKLRIRSLAQIEERRVRAMYTDWYQKDPHREVSLYCSLCDSILLSERVVNGKSSGENREEYDGVLVLYPLMRIYLGLVIRQLVEMGRAARVVTPDITAVDDNDRLLRLRISNRSARQIDNNCAGSERCFQFLGEQYDESARFWLDEGDRISRYEWHQRNPESGLAQHWEIVRV